MEVFYLVIALAAAVLAVEAFMRHLQYIMRLEVGYKPRPRHHSRALGYIYFFRGVGDPFWLVKIGRSNDPIKRLKTHRTSNAFGVQVLGVLHVKDDVAAETYLKGKYARNRISPGNEWFWFTPSLFLTVYLLRDRILTDIVKREVKLP